MNNKLKSIKKECLIKIENKKYYLYESYILNGTGYTFRIYANSKYSRERNNCFWNISSSIIVILGKNYNYILNRKNNTFEFDVIKYDKNILYFDILTLTNNSKFYSIFLKDSLIFSYDENEHFHKIWNNELNIRDKIIRKQKLINLNNA